MSLPRKALENTLPYLLLGLVAPWLVAASLRSLPLWSQSTLPCVSTPSYHRDTSHDLILTTYVCKETYLQVKSHSEVPGGHEFWGSTLQPITVMTEENQRLF